MIKLEAIAAMEEVRIDKWLWAARLFKTRREAAEACQAGKVKRLAGLPVGLAGGAMPRPDTPRVGCAEAERPRSVKPSRAIRVGDQLLITRKLYRQQIRVTDLRERRVSPQIAATLYEDITPAEEIEQVRLVRTVESAFHREPRRRRGRPTKRDRRALEKLKGRV